MTDAGQQAVETVERELRCARCGYVLRGLPVNGVCPECAEPIATSLRGNLLRVSDADWLRSLARGAAWSAWGVRLVFIMFFVYLLTLLVTEWLYPPPAQQATAPIVPMLNTMIYIALSLWLLTPIIIGIGLWMIMKPEPRESDRSEVVLFWRRALAAIVVPMLGVWFLLSHHALPLTLPGVVHLALIHFFAAVVIAQLWTLRDRLMELNGRSERPPRWGYMVAGGWRRWAFLIMPGLFLALYWIGPARSFSPPAGGWTMPTVESDRLLFFGFGLLWLSGAAMAGQYRPSIRHELTQAKRQEPDRPAAAS